MSLKSPCSARVSHPFKGLTGSPKIGARACLLQHADAKSVRRCIGLILIFYTDFEATSLLIVLYFMYVDRQQKLAGKEGTKSYKSSYMRKAWDWIDFITFFPRHGSLPTGHSVLKKTCFRCIWDWVLKSPWVLLDCTGKSRTAGRTVNSSVLKNWWNLGQKWLMVEEDGKPCPELRFKVKCTTMVLNMEDLKPWRRGV